MELGNKPKAFQQFEDALKYDPEHWVRKSLGIRRIGQQSCITSH